MIVSFSRAIILNFLVPRMIVNNRNHFLNVIIFLIIVTFSEELSVQRSRGVRELNKQIRNQPERQSDQVYIEEIPQNPIYYHRNDIGHLNEYYQERMKLREQFDAIQKSLQEQNLKNNTTPKKINFFDKQPVEKRKSPNINSLDAFHSLKPGKNIINQGFQAPTGINNIKIGSQNKTYVKMGECEGSVIYHQNIVITGADYQKMNGYSIDVNLEGLCITCIEIKSKNDREVKVTLTSGGPGKRNTSLNFEGHDKDVDLSYMLKVWGVGGNC